MNYRYLEAFIFAVHERNFTKAARRLAITPAALGRQIRLLEESINKQLIIRSPQSFVVTDDGEKLYEKAKDFDTWVQNEYSGNSFKTIRVMALQGIIENWLVDKLKSHQLNNNISYRIIKGEPSDTDKFLLENKVDIAITNKEFQNEVLSSRKLFKEEIVLVSKNKVMTRDIAKFRWITTNPKDYIINYAKKKNIIPTLPILYVESIRASIGLIEAGHGIAMMPFHLVEKNMKLYSKKISDFSEESIFLTMLNYSKAPSHLLEFIKFL